MRSRRTVTALVVCLAVLVAGHLSVQAQAAQTSGAPAFKTRSEAATWLTQQGMAATPDALVIYLMIPGPISPHHIRAFLLVGAPMKERHAVGSLPLSTAMAKCDGEPAMGEVVTLLLGGGADPNELADEAGRVRPLMAAAACRHPGALRAMLATKPDLNATDAKGRTAVHYAMAATPAVRDVNARLLRDAGFDLARWREALAKEFNGKDSLTFLQALVSGK